MAFLTTKTATSKVSLTPPSVPQRLAGAMPQTGSALRLRGSCVFQGICYKCNDRSIRCVNDANAHHGFCKGRGNLGGDAGAVAARPLDRLSLARRQGDAA